MRGRVGVIQVWGISVSGVEQKWLRWPAFRHSRQRIAVQGRIAIPPTRPEFSPFKKI